MERGEITLKKTFVTFYSPGTMVSESTTKEIEGWDVEEAVRMARDVKERHGAAPYGFRFSTQERRDDEWEARETERSGMYYLGGKVETLAEVEARNDPKEEILRSNMKCNGWNRIIVNTNSWRITLPLEENDVVLELETGELKA